MNSFGVISSPTVVALLQRDVPIIVQRAVCNGTLACILSSIQPMTAAKLLSRSSMCFVSGNSRVCAWYVRTNVHLSALPHTVSENV